MTATTSPLLPLLASVDSCRRRLALDGRPLLDRALAGAARLRSVLDALPGVRVVSRRRPRPGSPSHGPAQARRRRDRARSHRRRGRAAPAGALRRRRRGQRPASPVPRRPRRRGTDATSSGWSTACAASARRSSVAALRRVIRAGDCCARGRRPAHRARPTSPGASRCGLAASVGRIAAELVTPYPPGIPVLVPGEVIDAEQVAYLRTAAASRRAHPRSRRPDPRRVQVVARR